MTGFGRGTAEIGGIAVACEMRSVNGKGMDLRLRLPGRLERLEPQLKKAARDAIARGNVQAGLSIESEASGTELRIDHDALDRAVAMAREAGRRHDLAMPDLGAFLAMRGVVETVDAESDEDALRAAAKRAFAAGLVALQDDRAREGEAIEAALGRRVDEIAALVARAEADPARTPEAIRERLTERLAHLAEIDRLDPDRLHGEAAMLAIRADLSEEIDRLRAHVEAARELLASSEPVGRQLEFLAQEFGREANTLCAKSNAASLTAIGLELKVVIDQLREQVANVE